MNERNERERVLVVDDHPHSRQIVERLLTREGFDARQAASGHEAMDLLADEPFAAVVTDLEMPGMDGIELLRHIRRRHPRTPVVLMTPFFTEELCEGGLAWGAAAVLKKPFNSSRLGGVIRVALSRNAEPETVAA